MSKAMDITFGILVRVFGFWNVYYGAKNPRYFLICPFLGHRWHTEQEFKIEPTGDTFSLLKCLRCGRNKWV